MEYREVLENTKTLVPTGNKTFYLKQHIWYYKVKQTSCENLTKCRLN